MRPPTGDRGGVRLAAAAVPGYTLILRPLRRRTAIHAVVREQDRPVGVLELHRAEGEPPFGGHEQRRLRGVIPHAAHAAQAEGVAGAAGASEDRGP